MITIKDVRTLDGKILDYNIPSATNDSTIDAQKRLLLLPGVIDSHICLGMSTHEGWKRALHAAVQGGITTIIEVPCNPFLCDTKKKIGEKTQWVAKQMEEMQDPLDYLLYSSAEPQNSDAIEIVKNLSMGVVFFPILDQPLDDAAWNRIFQLAAWNNLPVVINARNENTVCKYTSKATGQEESLLEKALYYTQKQASNLYVLNVGKPEELYLIERARKKSILIHAETTPQHLFPNDPSKADFLWESLDNGLIDTIGSGYGLSTDESLSAHWYGSHYSHITLLLPLLLNAVHEKRTSLQTIVRLTSMNIKEFFRFEKTRHVVLVDLNKERTFQKIPGDPSSEQKLIGWPEYTIANGRVYHNVVKVMV